MARLVDDLKRYGAIWQLRQMVGIDMENDRMREIIASLPPHITKDIDVSKHGNVHVRNKATEVVFNEATRIGIERGQAIILDNVFRHLVETGERPDIAELPACVPPFADMWAEYRVSIPNNQFVNPNSFGQPVEAVGMYANTVDIWKDFGASTFAEAKRHIRWDAANNSPSARKLEIAFDEAAGEIRWVSTFALYVKVSGIHQVMGPFAVVSAYFEPSGHVAESTVQLPGDEKPRLLVSTDNLNKAEDISWSAANYQLYRMMCPIYVAMGFAHCKNIGFAEVEPVTKVQRARIRRGHPPLTTYKVLMIDPSRRAKPGHRHTEGSEGHRKALHVVRGHFAWYGPGHPDGRERGLLYGKHAGQFWIADHARGEAKAGVVHKRYAVEAATS
jgi:hypothetical protein